MSDGIYWKRSMAYDTPILSSDASGCHVILVADLLKLLGSFKIMSVFVVILSERCYGSSPLKYSSNKSISLFYLMQTEAEWTISLVAFENPRVVSL